MAGVGVHVHADPLLHQINSNEQHQVKLVSTMIDATELWKISDRPEYEFMISLPLPTPGNNNDNGNHDPQLPTINDLPSSPSSLSFLSLDFYWNTPSPLDLDGQISAEFVHKARSYGSEIESIPPAPLEHNATRSRLLRFDPLMFLSDSILWFGFGIAQEQEVLEGSKVIIGRTTSGSIDMDLGDAEDTKAKADADTDANTDAKPDIDVNAEQDEVNEFKIHPLHEVVLDDNFQQEMEIGIDARSFPDLDHLASNYIKQFIKRYADENGYDVNITTTILKLSQPMEALGISPMGDNYFIYGMGTYADTQLLTSTADDFSSFALDFKRVQLLSLRSKKSHPVASKRIFFVHGIFATLAFVLCMPFAFSSIFLREVTSEKWRTYHIFGTFFGGIFGLISLLLAILGKYFQDQSHFTDPHHIVGLFLILLTAVQLRNGVTTPGYHKVKSRIPSDLINDPRLLKEKRRFAFKVRMVVIASVFVLGLYQTGDGLCIFANNYNTQNLTPYLLIFIAIFTSCIVTCKVYFCLYADEIEKDRVGDVEELGHNWGRRTVLEDDSSHHEFL